MIFCKDEICDIKVQLEPHDQRLVGTEAVSINDLLDMIIDYKDEIDRLNEKYNDYKEYVLENYKPKWGADDVR